MQQTVGIIGASGDLGSQLLARLIERGVAVMPYSRKDGSERLTQLARACTIIHVCAPVEAIEHLSATDAIIVLHDSVMNTSRRASCNHLQSAAAIVHMLMNDYQTVVVASDAPHQDMIAQHFADLGYSTHSATVDEHDYLMARSQAPFALLCKTLLPFLYEQADQGLLTPSGQLLADTLRSRELAWTDATIHSILQNPQLSELMNDMRLTLASHQPWRQVDSVNENTLKTRLTL
jgi:hypothetical protein